MAGTITPTLNILGMDKLNPVGYQVDIAFVADHSDGRIPSVAINNKTFEGRWITKFIWNPGSPAPTALTDITCADADGIDLLDGEGLDLSATVTKDAPMTYKIPKGGFTVAITQPAAATIDAEGVLRIFID